MSYSDDFPNFANDTACATFAGRPDAWEDTSWYNDVCPSFTCDVFVVWCDHENAAERERPEAPRFCITDEGHTVLETEDFGDVLAFIDDGNRWGPYTGLNREFVAWVAAQGIGADEGDAEELLMVDRTPEQRAWLHDFIRRWDEIEPYAED